MCQFVHVHIWENYVSRYASYEPNTINNVTRNTGIHNFILLAYAPEQMCHLHVYVPLHQ